MSKTWRDRIIQAVITVAGSLIVFVSGAFYIYKRDGNVAIVRDVEKLKLTKADKIELNSKLNIIDYDKDQKIKWKSHDKINEVQEDRNEETYNMVKFLYEEQIKKSNR